MSRKIVKMRHVKKYMGYVLQRDKQLLVILLHCISQPMEMQPFAIKPANVNVTNQNARIQAHAKNMGANVSQKRLFLMDGILLKNLERKLFAARN